MLIITGNFNIRNRDWDLEYSFHLVYSDLLSNITDAFDLSFLHLINPIPTRYLDNLSKSNSVIDLMFLWSSSSELNTHHIHPDWHCLSDHIPFMVIIPVKIEESGLDLFYFSFHFYFSIFYF